MSLSGPSCIDLLIVRLPTSPPGVRSTPRHARPRADPCPTHPSITERSSHARLSRRTLRRPRPSRCGGHSDHPPLRPARRDGHQRAARHRDGRPRHGHPGRACAAPTPVGARPGTRPGPRAPPRGRRSHRLPRLVQPCPRGHPGRACAAPTPVGARPGTRPGPRAPPRGRRSHRLPRLVQPCPRGPSVHRRCAAQPVPRPVEVPSPTPRRSCSARHPLPATRRVSSPQHPRQRHPTTNTPKGRTHR
jgi:hypothetical protein